MKRMIKNNKRARLYIGLPGSGKSFWIKNIVNKIGYKVIDDPKNFDEDILPYIHKNIIVADPHLCDPKIRESAIEKLESLGYSVSCVFFENNPEACMKNIHWRDDGRQIKNLDSFNYQIPDGVDIIKIRQSPD